MILPVEWFGVLAHAGKRSAGRVQMMLTRLDHGVKDVGSVDIQVRDEESEGRATAGSAVTVKPVVNAIRIIRYLGQAGAPQRSVDIARSLAINSSTCFNILKTLVAEDVVEFNPMSKRYSTGLGLARLVEQFFTRGQRIQLAKPVLQELALRLQATITLWQRMGPDRIVIVSSVTSPTDVRIDMAEGQRLPIMMGASGRLFATQIDLDLPGTRAAFEKMRWARPLSFEDYQREVEASAKQGWASDDGYFSVGILSVAAPVYSPAGVIEFTVSAVTFRGQRNKAEIALLGESLCSACEQLKTILF